jgi:hypothetical protein
MKKGPNSLCTAENVFGSAKHENESGRRRIPPKTSSATQNMKTGADALGTFENESGSAQHENVTRCPRYRRN